MPASQSRRFAALVAKSQKESLPRCTRSARTATLRKVAATFLPKRRILAAATKKKKAAAAAGKNRRPQKRKIESASRRQQEEEEESSSVASSLMEAVASAGDDVVGAKKAKRPSLSKQFRAIEEEPLPRSSRPTRVRLAAAASSAAATAESQVNHWLKHQHRHKQQT